MPGKKFDFSNFARLQSAGLVRTKHFHRYILIGLALIQKGYFVEYLSVAASIRIEIDIKYPGEITKY